MRAVEWMKGADYQAHEADVRHDNRGSTGVLRIMGSPHNANHKEKSMNAATKIH